MRVFKYGLVHDKGGRCSIVINWHGLWLYLGLALLGKVFGCVVYKKPFKIERLRLPV